MKVSSNLTGKLLAGAAIGIVGLIGVSQAQDQPEINVLLPEERATPLYPIGIAPALGCFDEEGIKVNLLASDTTIPFVAFLQNRQADVVMLDAPQTIQAIGANVPISVVYEAMQFAPEGIATQADSEVKSMKDLKGTTVGLASDRDQVTLQIALDAEGMSIDDVDTVVVGDAGPVMAKAFRDKTISAFAGGINDWSLLGANGIPIREITPAAVEENPANNLTILKERTEELRPVLTKFLRCWTKGAMAGKIDPQVVAGIAREWIPEEWEGEEFGQALLKSSFKVNFPITERWGDLQPDVWKKVQPPMVKFGVLDQEVDPSTFLDDSFIAEANNFDVKELEATVAKWKADNPDKIK